ncbi:MAG: hypothetical protein Q9202_003224 [Teloschistes flavicans]
MAETPSRPTTTEPTTPLMASDNGTTSPPTETEEVIDAPDDDEDADSDDGLDPFRDDDPTLHNPYPLRLINPLASFHVSSSKPTCSIASLLHPSIATYWQSDGPQPHTLTAHFFKRVYIVKLRLLLDFKRDESYTPTRMEFWAGTGRHDLCVFGAWEGVRPSGWVDVLAPLHDDGGSDGGEEEGGWGRKEKGIWCHLVEVRVLENHQNGKDTHMRGIQIFSLADEKGVRRGLVDDGGEESEDESMEDEEEEEEEEEEDEDGGGGGIGDGRGVGRGKSLFDRKGMGGMDEPDWLREPVIR